ncbi:MAG: DUF4330 family protein [Oscillospiraceae bacterium]|nr:DUF4330 family protein [Oscillospiraceae bacterium]
MKDTKKKYRFNIIDILVLIVIAAGVCLFALKFIGDGGSPVSNDYSKTVRIVYAVDETPEYVVEQMKLGDTIYYPAEECNIGVITDLKSGPSVSYTELEAGPKDGYNSVYITGEMSGVTVTDHGVVAGKSILAPGHTLVIYAGVGKVYAKVYSFEVIG